MRRVGTVTVALLIGTTSAVLAISLLGADSTVTAAAVSVLISVPTTWIAWASYRAQSEVGGGDGLRNAAEIADALAAAVEDQWTREWMARRIHNPCPLPVGWAAADRSLFEPWKLLLAAADAVPATAWPTIPTPRSHRGGPATLQGRDSEIAEIYARVPTGRLVILGDPGSGKSILAIRLMLGMLARRPPGGPVPVLASLASWDPERTDVYQWLWTQLRVNHPGLRATTPGDPGAPNRFQALLDRKLIVPVLDGLDEMVPALRKAAIANLNSAVRPGQPFVLTSRTAEYREIVRPADGPEITLRGATGIEILPLPARAVRDYLRHAAGGPVSAAKWKPVNQLLADGSSPLAEALRTPLMVSMANLVYNADPTGPGYESPPQPAELCALPGDRAAIERHLLDAFVTTVYRTGEIGQSNRWARHAQHWLGYLASHLTNNVHTVDFAWWELYLALPRGLLASVVGASCGTVAGTSTALILGPQAGAATAAAVFAIVSLALVLPVRTTTDPASGDRPRTVGRPRAALDAATAAVMKARGSRHDQPHRSGGPRPLLLGGSTPRGSIRWRPRGPVRFLVAATLGIALAFAVDPIAGFATFLGVTIPLGLRGVPDDLRSATSPHAVLVRDRRGSALFAVIFAAAGLVQVVFPAAGATWFAVGTAAGIVASSDQSLWPWWALARVWLAYRRKLPWRLLSFLLDAHDRGILRQSGAYYQFRHQELQNRLVERFAAPPRPKSHQPTPTS